MNIVIFGDKKDNQISKILIKNLSENYKINSISDGKLISLGNGETEVNLIETSKLNEIRLDNSVLILKNSVKLNMVKFIGRTTKVIISAGNERGITKLNNHLANVITCGYSAKDYITFSSRDDAGGMISLQRSIKQNGKIIEPFEIPFEKNGIESDYAVLSACLAMIMLGHIKENPTNKNSKIYF